MQKRIKKIFFIVTVIILVVAIQNSSKAADKDITNTFRDENLKNEILELAKEATGDSNKTQIYESDIDNIVGETGGTSLRLANKGIKDLSGIEIFAKKEITWIFIDWNEITDLTPLRRFENLTKISFSGNNVEDISPLADIKNLENITGINNKINTIESLQNLRNIKYICLDGNNISNIDSIVKWTKLEELSFQNNQIEEIPNLSNLTQLRTINLSNNKIKTIDNIGKISSLEKLEIGSNEITDLSGIGNLTNLKILNCNNNKISNLKGIENAINLENVNLNKNQLQNIEGIEKNQLIKYLYLDNNHITNFEELKELANLGKYSIYNQTISIEIKEKLTGEYILIPLPELYGTLYDTNSFIYEENLKTEVLNGKEYEIDENNKNVKLKAEDLKNNSITLQVSNSENIILSYNIQLDKQAPSMQGIENDKTYNTPVTPTSIDDDIQEVKLLKDGQEIAYTLGNEINSYGQYTLILKDFADNETRINFEIIYELEINEIYEINGQYVENISRNTKLEIFNKNLNANLQYNVYRNNQLLNSSQIVATGDTLIAENEKTYYIIVRGDITKDGNTNIKDLVRIRRNLLKLENFDELENKAADLSKDGKITIKDLVQIRNIIIH